MAVRIYFRILVLQVLYIQVQVHIYVHAHIYIESILKDTFGVYEYVARYSIGVDAVNYILTKFTSRSSLLLAFGVPYKFARKASSSSLEVGFSA